MENFKLLLFLFFLSFAIQPALAGKLVFLKKYSIVPNLSICQPYLAEIVVLNNGTTEANIVKEEAIINSNDSIYPAATNPSALEPKEKEKFFLKIDEVNSTLGTYEITYNLTTETAEISFSKEVRVKNPLEISTSEDLGETKVTKFKSPYSLPLQLENSGPGKIEYDFTLDYPKATIQPKLETAKRAYFLKGLEQKSFRIGGGKKRTFSLILLPVKAGKTGELEIQVSSLECGRVNDSLSLRYQTITSTGGVLKVHTQSGLNPFILLILPGLALLFYRASKSNIER